MTVPEDAIDTHSNRAPVARRLRRGYLLGLGIAILFIIAAQLMVQLSIREQYQDSRVVNIAGRQRMLSQKLVKVALKLSTAKNQRELDEYTNELEVARTLWVTSHRALLYGDIERGLPPTQDHLIIERYRAIEPYLEVMRNAAAALATEVSGVPLADVNRKRVQVLTGELGSREALFLAEMDRIVFAYDDLARDKVQDLAGTERALTLLTLAVFGFVAVFVFEPAVRVIQQQFIQLARNRDEKADLAANLQDALDHVRQLHGMLPICASCKKIRDDDGYWTQIEVYLEHNSDAEFSHGMCPECVEQLYPNFRKNRESPRPGRYK
jgi:hypothetical protein